MRIKWNSMKLFNQRFTLNYLIKWVRREAWKPYGSCMCQYQMRAYNSKQHWNQLSSDLYNNNNYKTS